MTPKQKFTAYQTLVIKELVRCFRIWPQTLLPPAITMALYFVIFGRLVGSQIHAVDGFTYMQYIVPGLVMMSVITNSYMHSSGGFFSMKFQRSIEEILVSPTPNSIVLFGFITGAVVRGLVVALIVMLISLFFTHLKIDHVLLVLLTILLTSFFFATAGLINGMYARNFDDLSWVPSFVLTPLTYLGGVFFSISMLSPFWQKIALINPIFYAIDLFRYSVLGLSQANIVVEFSVLFLLDAMLFFAALYMVRTSLRLRN